MLIAQLATFAASKKEPLAEMMGRVRQAFLDAGLGEPTIRFTFLDRTFGKGASAIDRALKRHPELEHFVSTAALMVGSAESRILSNATTGEPIDYSALQEIAAGVPRSYPFASVMFHFHAAEFGERLIGLPKWGNSLPGIWMTDGAWITGRQRALAAYTVVDAQETDKKLPPNPPSIDALIKACGKVRRTEMVPIRASGGDVLPSIPPEKAEAVKAVVADFRARIQQIIAAAELPHNLPPAAEIRAQNAGVLAGPRKPALDAAFKPMGYSCRGGSGTFHLTRRTAANLTVELYLDVGTWSHAVTASMSVHGAGFKASMRIPPAAGDMGQYPIGDAAQWQKIVDNLAAVVRYLDRTFVPEIEQTAGPSPAWYHPST